MITANSLYQPPAHRLAVAGTATVWSTTATEITVSGTYLISAGSAGHVRITDTSDTTTPAGNNGISLAEDEKFYVFIKSGQFIHFDSATGVYILMSPQ